MIRNKELKRRIVNISYQMKLSHLGSNLTAVDIIDKIYKIKKPDEKFVLSAGHAHLAHLVVMEDKLRETGMTQIDGALREYNEDGLPVWIPETVIKAFGIHCARKAGCDASTGSLGHGIGIAVGMALSDRTKNVYCLLSDGELAEGSVWEALRIAADNNLRNLKIYINYNGWAAYQKTTNPIYDLYGEDYGRFDPIEIHVMEISMEQCPKWLQGQIAHYKILNKEEYEEVMEVLK